MSLASSTLERRVLLGVVLVVVAFAAAGLAVAADRPHTDAWRPELTARADRLFAPWRDRLATELTAASAGLGSLSISGRDVLGSLYRTDLEAVERALAVGGATVGEIDSDRAALAAVRGEQAESVADARLSQSNVAFLTVVDQAAAGLAGVAGAWASLESVAGFVTQLVTAFEEHDAAVVEATTAGRDGRWSEALNGLRPAEAALDRARRLRDALAARSDVTTLDDLLVRYGNYDDALERLYEALAGGEPPTSPAVIALAEDVELAQAALPADRSAMVVAVAGAVGTAPVDALADIEEARGLIDEALSMVP